MKDNDFEGAVLCRTSLPTGVEEFWMQRVNVLCAKFSVSSIGILIRKCTVVISLWLGLFNFSEARADFEGAWEAYQNGEYNFAVREFLWCAEKGNDLCQLYLADIYYYGHGTIVRRDKATYWYTKSAKQKNADAAQRLFAIVFQNAVHPW